MKRGVLLIVGVVFLIVFGLVAFLSARGSHKKAPVEKPTLSIWAPFDEKKVYEKMTGDFFAQHPETNFEFRYIEATDAKEYEAKVVDAIASGTGPDIWLIRTDWLAKHEAKLIPAPETMKWSTSRRVKENQALKETFGEAVLAQNSRSGRLYGVPLAVDSLALFINQNVISAVRKELTDAKDKRADLLRNEPKTWAELEEWVRLITKKDRTGITRAGIALGTVDNGYAPVDIYLALLAQKKGSLYAANESDVALHQVLADGSIPAVKALDFYHSFSTPDHPNYSWNKSLGDPVQAFFENKLAMMVGFSTVRQQLLRLNPEIKGITVAALPQDFAIAIPTDERVDYAAYWTHVVAKTSDNPALAWELLKFFSTAEPQRYYGTQTLKPTLESVKKVPLNEISSTNFNLAKVFAQQAVNARPIFKPEWQFIDETLQTMIRSATDGGQNAQAAVDTAATALKNRQ